MLVAVEERGEDSGRLRGGVAVAGGVTVAPHCAEVVDG